MIVLEHILDFLRLSFSNILLIFWPVFIFISYWINRLCTSFSRPLKVKNWCFFTLLFISLVPRVLLFIKAPETSISTEYSEALSIHFWDYFWNDSYKPPLNTLVFAFLNLFTTKNYIAFTLVLDVFALQLLFAAAYGVTKKSLFSMFVIAIYSLTILPFEFWRQGVYWDHFTTILIASLIYSLAQLKDNISNKNILLCSLSGGLLISQSTVNIAIIPVYFLIVTCILLIPMKEYKKAIFLYIKLISIPSLIIAFCLIKNYMTYNIFATSILGGEGLILTTTRMFDDGAHPDFEMYRNEVIKTKPPKWWMWCWDWASKNYADTNANTYYGNTGYCYRFIERPPHCTPSVSKTIDFSPILGYLKKHGPEDVLAVVERSQKETCMMPWLHMPTNLEFRHKFRGLHSKATTNVAKGIIKNNLKSYLKSTLRLHIVHGVLGPRLQRIWIDQPNITPWELIHKLGVYLQSSLYKKILKVHEYILSLSYIVAWFTLLFTLITSLLTLKRSQNRNILYLTRKYQDLIFFLPPIFGNAIIFTMAVGGENHRYFFQSTPYLIIFFIIFSSKILEFLDKKIKTKPLYK